MTSEPLRIPRRRKAPARVPAPGATSRTDPRSATLAVAVAVTSAFLAIHAQIWLFPDSFFSVLHADEIRDVVLPRDLLRAGHWPVLSLPPGHIDGGGIVLGYLLAALPVDSPHGIVVAARVLAVLQAGAALMLWTRCWMRAFGARAGALAAVLMLFPQKGWITNTVQAFGTYGPGSLAAVGAVTVGMLRDAGPSSSRSQALLGAALGLLALVAPAAAPTVAAVLLVSVYEIERHHGASRAAVALARLTLGGATACAVLLMLDAWSAEVNPLAQLVGFVSRAPAADGSSHLAVRIGTGFANLFSPERVWLMPWPLFYGLLGLAAVGSVLGIREAEGRDTAQASPAIALTARRRLALVCATAAVVTLGVHLVTRFAESATWNVTPILPHLVGLAAIALARGTTSGWITRLPAVAYLAAWIASGFLAYEERFVVREADLRYPGVAVMRSVAPLLESRGVSRIASTYHWALPLDLALRADRHAAWRVCCTPRSNCPVECESGFFADDPEVFVFPGPAAHLHGEPETATLAPRLLVAAYERGIPLKTEALSRDGTWRTLELTGEGLPLLAPNDVVLLATAPPHARALEAVLLTSPPHVDPS